MHPYDCLVEKKGEGFCCIKLFWYYDTLSLRINNLSVDCHFTKVKKMKFIQHLPADFDISFSQMIIAQSFFL